MSHILTPHTIVDPAAKIGVRTTLGFFVHVMAGASIGDACEISDHVTVEADSIIGNRVTIQSGVFVRRGIRVADDVFIGANVCFPANPRVEASQSNDLAIETLLEEGATIAGNATILPGVRIGQGATVTAGAVVTRSVPPNAIVVGNPAQITGYVTSSNTRAPGTPLNPSIYPEEKKPRHHAYPTAIPGVFKHSFPLIQDLRGDLSVGEFSKNIPFQPQRYFLVFNVQNSEIRGEHAHRKCQQFLVSVAGSCRVVADDGRHREEFLLNSPTEGLYLPAMIWATQYKYTTDGVLLVFASEYYDPKDYIRDYSEFLNSTLK